MSVSFPRLEHFSAIIFFSKKVSGLFSLSFPSEDLYNVNSMPDVVPEISYTALIFYNFFFFCLAWVISSILSFQSTDLFSVSSTSRLTHYSVLFISKVIFFSSVWVLLIFTNSIEILLVFIYSFPKFVEHLHNHYIELYWVDCLYYTQFFS